MKKQDILFFGLVIFCIIVIVFLVFYMRSETTQCVKNPFIYGAIHMKNVGCSCLQRHQDGQISSFSFNETNLFAVTP